MAPASRFLLDTSKSSLPCRASKRGYQAPLLAAGTMDALGLLRRQVERCEVESVTILCYPEAGPGCSPVDTRGIALAVHPRSSRRSIFDRPPYSLPSCATLTSTPLRRLPWPAVREQSCRWHSSPRLRCRTAPVVPMTRAAGFACRGVKAPCLRGCGRPRARQIRWPRPV